MSNIGQMVLRSPAIAHVSCNTRFWEQHFRGVLREVDVLTDVWGRVDPVPAWTLCVQIPPIFITLELEEVRAHDIELYGYDIY